MPPLRDCNSQGYYCHANGPSDLSRFYADSVLQGLSLCLDLRRKLHEVCSVEVAAILLQDFLKVDLLGPMADNLAEN